MKTNTSKNTVELFIILGIVSISLFFWDSLFTYPIKIFIVLLHEISHAIITVLTGGKVISINLASDLSGITVTNGGNSLLIATAGYLGSLVIGCLLVLSSKYEKLRKWVTPILSLTILLVTVNLMVGGIQIFLSLIIALIFFIIPKYFGQTFNKYFLKIIGLSCCLYVLVDIKQDLLTLTPRETDTQILEYLTGIPALAIGSFWFLISLVAIYFLIREMTFSK